MLRLHRPGTLGSRIVLSTTLVAALALVTVLVATYFVVGHSTGNALNSALEDDLSTVSSTLSLASNGKLHRRALRNSRVDSTTWIFDARGARVFGPEDLEDSSDTVDDLRDVRSTHRFNRHGRAYLARPVRDKQGKAIAVVVVAEPTGPYDSSRLTLLIALGVVGLLALAGTAVISALTVRRTLRPVTRMSTSAEEWSQQALDTRFAVGGATDEIAGLGQTLNLLLDRVASAIRSEQRLTSELAHELRTPLTGIRGEAELTLLTTEDPDTSERLERIVEQVDRLGATITTLMSISRGEAGDDRRAPAEPVLRELLAHFTVPEGVRLDIAVQGPHDVVVPTAPFSRSLAPLVDNALRFARSRVTVTVVRSTGQVVVRVEDDGTGVNPSAFDPGASTGSGLGLPLARRIASSMGGRIELTHPAGPTTFELSLPLH